MHILQIIQTFYYWINSSLPVIFHVPTIFNILIICFFVQVLQHILNPAFLYSFEKNEGEQLLGPPNPEGDNQESITSVFITKVLLGRDSILYMPLMWVQCHLYVIFIMALMRLFFAGVRPREADRHAGFPQDLSLAVCHTSGRTRSSSHP